MQQITKRHHYAFSLCAILAVTLSLLFANCEQSKQPQLAQAEPQSISCETPAPDSTYKVPPRKQKRLINGKQVQMMPKVCFEFANNCYKAWGTKATLNAQRYVDHFRAASRDSLGIDIKPWQIVVNDKPDGYTSSAANTLRVQFRKDKPIINGDVGVLCSCAYVNGGVAERVGGIGTDDNRAIVLINPNFADFPRFEPPIQAGLHETIAHLFGVPHPHDKVYTREYKGITYPFQSWDYYGTWQGYGVASKQIPLDEPMMYPKKPSISSYAILPKAATHFKPNFAYRLYDVEKQTALAFIENAPNVGGIDSPLCANGAYGLTCINGVVSWKDGINSGQGVTYQTRPIRGVWSEAKEILPTTKDVYVNDKPVEYSASNIKGNRFTIASDIWAKYDTITFTIPKLPTGVTIAYSFQNGSSSYGAQDKVIDGNKIVIPKGKPITALQIRTSKEVGLKVSSIELSRTVSGGAPTFTPTDWQPNKYYQVAIGFKCAPGQSIKDRVFTIYNPPAVWSKGTVIYDSGGATGLYGNNEDYSVYVPSGVVLNCSQFVVEPGVGRDYMELWRNGVLVDTFVYGKATPFTINGGCELRFKSDSGTPKAGFKLEVK